jgi:hypothetical protein
MEIDIQVSLPQVSEMLSSELAVQTPTVKVKKLEIPKCNA